MATEQLEAPIEQRRTKVWTHPDRAQIEALLIRGKSASWIAYWLEERYPLTEPDPDAEEGEPQERDHPDRVKHARWHLTPTTLDGYRTKWMPETQPGTDIVLADLEDIVGRELPAPRQPDYELELMESAVRVAQHNLAKALKSDEEMEMVQPTTLDAHSRFVNSIEKSVDVKQKLNLPGYERAPERLEVDQTNRNLSVELHGRIGRNGAPEAVEPEKVRLVNELLTAGPEKAHEVIAAAQAAAQAEREATADADTIDADATDIPEDGELDGREGEGNGDAGAAPEAGEGEAPERGGDPR